MSQEILINVTPPETRVAILENGVVQEVIIERTRKRGIVGNIYSGKVVRVLPGMQAAFVDVGLERAAFLHVQDMHNGNNGSQALISELVQPGSTLIVQATKDPLGSKGARLTTQLSIPSRFLVYLPNEKIIGISKRIDDEQERIRLEVLIETSAKEMNLKGGFIVRTASENCDQNAIRSDMLFLSRIWEAISKQTLTAEPCQKIHSDLPLALRILRDLAGDHVEKIRIDSRATYERARGFVDQFIPEVKDKLEYYPGERPIFELYGVEDEIKRALEPKVELKSGGYIILDQTEAMTTIDVNTGGFVGHKTLEETIFKTNLEAAQTICRQLRLRNLGGIIIIDFIDMLDKEHKAQVIRTLEKCLQKDPVKTQISEVSTLGLVEMTRKRTRESLENVLCEPCPSCLGRGTQKTAETTCYDIFREILRESRLFEVESLLILASSQVVDLLMDEESTNLIELEQFIEKPIRLQAEQLYTQEQYDIILL